MESWRYLSGEKGFLSEDINTPSDSLASSKQSLLAWESRNLCNFSNHLFSTQQQIPSQGFGGLSSLDMVGKQVLDSPLSSKTANGKITNPVSSFSNQLHGDESIYKLSGSIGESNSRDSSLIDLKLGRFADSWDAQCYKDSKGNQIFSPSESATPLKRIRGSPVNLQTAFCQVLGCNKDLSSSKDYHKRHKVCEVHSKTARVIVNGIEQRFCQQCSRFHLLTEFDDGKRSCRKRLAGHNERRRKPQVGMNSRRSGMLLSSCNDKYVANQWMRPIKVEERNDDDHQHRLLLTVPMIDGFLQSKSFFPHCDIETQFPPFAHNGTIFNETGSHYSLPVGGLDSSSQSLFNGSEEFAVFDEASTVRSLSISDPGCALSLLSAQSHNSSDHSSEARSLLVPIDQTHYNMNQLSEKLMRASSQASTSGVSNKVNLSAEGCQVGPILTSDTSDTVNFKIFDRNLHGSSESRPTVNLLQLSSQLQRVEHQRTSMQAKRENNAVCCLRIT